VWESFSRSSSQRQLQAATAEEAAAAEEEAAAIRAVAEADASERLRAEQQLLEAAYEAEQDATRRAELAIQKAKAARQLREHEEHGERQAAHLATLAEASQETSEWSTVDKRYVDSERSARAAAEGSASSKPDPARRRSVFDDVQHQVEFDTEVQFEPSGFGGGFGAFGQATIVQASSQQPTPAPLAKRVSFGGGADASRSPRSPPSPSKAVRWGPYQKEQIEKVIKLQAAFRGKVVREELFWNDMYVFQGADDYYQ